MIQRQPVVEESSKVETLTPASQLSPAMPLTPQAVIPQQQQQQQQSRNKRNARAHGKKKRNKRNRRSGELPALPAAQMGRIEVNGTSIPPERWQPDQVVQWLSMMQLQRYARAFRTAGVTGIQLMQLSAEKLAALVPDFSDQLRIKNALSVLMSPVRWGGGRGGRERGGKEGERERVCVCVCERETERDRYTYTHAHRITSHHITSHCAAVARQDFASVDERVAASVQSAAPITRAQKVRALPCLVVKDEAHS